MIDKEYETFFPLFRAMIRDTSVADQEKENQRARFLLSPASRHRGQGDWYVGCGQSTHELTQWVWFRSQRELSELWWCNRRR